LKVGVKLEEKLPITDYRLPITDYPLPITHYQKTSKKE
jgi:hypothetical protein